MATSCFKVAAMLLGLLLLQLPAGAQSPVINYLLDETPDAPWQHNAPIWGRLASQGFENQRIKATLFFAGQALDGTNKYGCTPAPGDNRQAYTMHPVDGMQLAWSQNPESRAAVISEMQEAGINVINMSTWGESFLPCAWVSGAAPMQTSPQAHDELFAATAGKPVLIVPFIESRGGQFPWSFRGEFPKRPDGQVAPGTVNQIVDLVNRYLKNPRHPEWASKWVQVYDQQGMKRYAVVIIHAASDFGDTTDASFASGFDSIAREVRNRTQVDVGFFIDTLPRDFPALGRFKPNPETTRPFLWRSSSILGIQCFIPEIWMGSTNTADVIRWKREFSRRWFQTGIPFIMDVSPGYDAHIIFGGKGYGISAAWRNALSGMVRDFGTAGVMFNAWNGYTEGLVAVPTTEYGRDYFRWLQSL